MIKFATHLTLLSLSTALISSYAYAEVFSPFKDSDGNTKWQYVANFSSSVLILTLLVVSIFLFIAHRRAARSNRELIEIKADLEDRVSRRTASLESTTLQLANREAYIKSIVDSMPIMLIGLNKNMEITQWNHVAEAITGRPFDTIAGMNLWEAYPTITLTQEQVEGVLDSKKTTTIKHGQRDQYYFDITLYALTEQEETGIVILVDDITKQMKAENKLVERNKMSAMGELASAMAHDINVPLQSITHSLSIIQQQTNQIPEAQKQLITPILNKAQKSGVQATATVQNLLDFSASHQGKKQSTHIAQILDHSIELANSLYAQPNGLSFHGIALNRNYADDVPSVPCYASEMQQVFLRLFRHAFYALCEQANGTGFVPVINVEVGNFYDSVWIKIQHNGSALSAEEQQDIFEPFFYNTTNARGCAVEQRLSYSHFIITDHHKGQIAVTSEHAGETTFHIQLPLK
ncbi:two-component system sensor histidine kinase NtrB [Marinagarivorans algicola]|uniref:two-component system sensor histidine kinase NtrB n=1 Tax=Marinagarivorans algicola TaxID=1513270 RepID=UPI0006B4EC9C|nr:ATP-binding protein [Marinagarivorans algicola]